MESIQVFDIAPFVKEGGAKDESTVALCRALAYHICQTGILILKDPR